LSFTRWSRTAIVLLCVSAFTLVLNAEALASRAGAPLWNSQYPNSYMVSVGSSPDGTRIYETGTAISSGNYSIVSIAYNAATGGRLWATTYAGGFENYATSLAVSPDGTKVFVIGYYLTDVQGDDFDWSTIAYDASSGRQLWTRTYDGPVGGVSRDEPTSIVVTPDGSKALVTGFRQTGPDTVGERTVSFDAVTGSTIWARNRANEFGNDLELSPDETTVFVVGNVLGQPYAAGTVAYDVASGEERWANTWYGLDRLGAMGRAIAISPDGQRVFVAGTVLTPRQTSAFGTIAYRASDGATIWARRHDDAPGHFGAELNGLLVDPSGTRLFITGRSIGRLSSTDYVTMAFDAASGKKLWVRSYDSGRGEDVANDVAVDPSGRRIYVTGGSRGREGYDYFTIAYRGDGGQEVWSRRDVKGDSGDALIALKDEVVVTGRGTLAGRTIAYAT
jgi:hypothetical protein